MIASGISVVVPVYGRSETLPACLRAAAAALMECAGGVEIILVEDAGPVPPEMEPVTQMSGVDVVWLRERCNRGFGGACNDGVQAARNPLVMLLNSDVILNSDALSILVDEMTEEDFSVTPRISIGKGDGPCESVSYFFERRGRLGLGHLGMSEPSLVPRAACDIAYGCGAATLLRRDRFLALGGFSQLFAPYYWEDADLGWRAWKRGWPSRFVPAARAVHYHGATIGDSAKVRAVREAHRLVFVAADIESPRIRARLALWSPVRLIVDGIRRPETIRAIPLALRGAGEVARHKARRVSAGAPALTDEQLLRRFAPFAMAGEWGRR